MLKRFKNPICALLVLATFQASANSICASFLENAKKAISGFLFFDPVALEKLNQANVFKLFEKEVRRLAGNTAEQDLANVRATIDHIQKQTSLYEIEEAKLFFESHVAHTVDQVNARRRENLVPDSTPRPTTQEVWKAFSLAPSDCGIYEPTYCHHNVIRLFDHLKKQIPNLKPEHFDVVYLRAQGPFEFSSHSAKVGWSHHTILVYGDLVLDLDVPATQASPIKLRDYVLSEYRHNVTMIDAFVIRGDDYIPWGTAIVGKDIFVHAILTQKIKRPIFAL